MRITGGQAKGRRLAPLKGFRIRPSSDLVRQAIFNLTGQDVRGVKVLDLFAGTGSLGIEALSRGAQWALFIDQSEQAIKLIKKNLKLCGYERFGSIHKKDLVKGLPLKTPMMKRKFELVFLDPPYGKKLIPPLLGELSDKDVLAPSAIVVAESSKIEALPAKLGRLKIFNTKIYGETKIDLYEYGVSQCA